MFVDREDRQQKAELTKIKRDDLVDDDSCVVCLTGEKRGHLRPSIAVGFVEVGLSQGWVPVYY